MPFYKKPYNKQQKVCYPRAVVQGNPVETEIIAKDLAKISTVSNSDVQAVLGGISGVMHSRMLVSLSNVVYEALRMGMSVDLAELGNLRLTVPSKMMDTPKEVTVANALKTPKITSPPSRRCAMPQMRWN